MSWVVFSYLLPSKVCYALTAALGEVAFDKVVGKIGRRGSMKWITRERAKVDRIACPWLISRFIDPHPEFVYGPAERVLVEAERQGAVPYNIPDVELGHKGPLCSFDAFMSKCGFQGSEPALDRLALIVRGADTSDKDVTPESRGLDAIAGGFQKMDISDHEKLEREFPVYDALYVYCGGTLPTERPRSRV